MKYTLKHFMEEFPNEEACFRFLIKRRFPDKKLYLIKNRKEVVDEEGKHYYPLKGLIFERSKTNLMYWFYAIFLMANSKNGVSGRELARIIGVTEKTALRMLRKIRELTEQDNMTLKGTVEIDEAYMGSKKRHLRGRGTNKKPVVGIVERKGRAITKVTGNVNSMTLTGLAVDNIDKKATVMTDEFKGYKYLKRHFKHYQVQHGRRNFARKYKGKNIHTNSVEGLWNLIKSGIRGTHHGVSTRYLQGYVDFYTFHYNSRLEKTHPFHLLLDKVV